MQSENKKRLRIARTFVMVAIITLHQTLADTVVPEDVATATKRVADYLSNHLETQDFLYFLSPPDEVVETIFYRNYQCFLYVLKGVQHIKSVCRPSSDTGDEREKQEDNI